MSELETATDSKLRARTRRVLLIAAQIAVIVAFLILVFVMWLPWFVSKK